MRVKLKNRPNTFIEFWPTRISKARMLWVHYILQTNRKLHFFFSCSKSDVIHVLSFPRGLPYRISDETEGSAYMAKYFESDFDKINFQKGRKSYQYRTWKLWGTDYIKEMNTGYSLSHYKSEHESELYQYLIMTEDECIEVIGSGYLHEWQTFKNKKIETIIQFLIKKDNKS